MVHLIRSSAVRKLLVWSSERTSDFVSKSGKTATETQSSWKCLWEWSSVCTNMFEWLGSFGEGCEDPEDDPRSARPSAAWNPEAVAEVYQRARVRQMTRKVMERILHVKRETIRQIIPEALGNRSAWSLPPPPSQLRGHLRDCEPLHANYGLVDFRHIPSSPDLAPADFFLLPKMNSAFKGGRFQDVEDVKYNISWRMKCSLFGLLRLLLCRF